MEPDHSKIPSYQEVMKTWTAVFAETNKMSGSEAENEDDSEADCICCSMVIKG